MRLFDKIEDSFKKIEELVTNTREDFESIIKDKSIPVDERWELFCKAPDLIKNHDNWIHQFKWEQTHRDIDWYEDFYKEKYETVDMETIIEHMKENIEDDDWSEEMILDMKEEILDKNLASFIMDW